MKKISRLKYILGLALLIAAAFELPRLLFAVQDREKMGEVGRGDRSGINFAALAENYEPSLSKRLARFAEGQKEGRDFYVAEAAFELSEEEKTKILTPALLTDTGIFLDYAEAVGLYYWDKKGRRCSFSWSGCLDLGADGIAVKDWKKYVVYDAEKVDFICWYADVFLDEEHEIRVLIDAEDGTIYYSQAVRNDEVSPNQAAAGENRAAAGEKGQKQGAALQNDSEGIIAWNVELVEMFWAFLMVSYDADWESFGFAGDIAEEIKEWKERPAENSPEVMLAQLEIIFAIKGYDLIAELDKLGKEIYLADSALDFRLNYGGTDLKYELSFDREHSVRQESEVIRINMGVTDLGGLIPELKK